MKWVEQAKVLWNISFEITAVSDLIGFSTSKKGSNDFQQTTLRKNTFYVYTYW